MPDFSSQSTGRNTSTIVPPTSTELAVSGTSSPTQLPWGSVYPDDRDTDRARDLQAPKPPLVNPNGNRNQLWEAKN
jgi:hypothetical protein